MMKIVYRPLGLQIILFHLNIYKIFELSQFMEKMNLNTYNNDNINLFKVYITKSLGVNNLIEDKHLNFITFYCQ